MPHFPAGYIFVPGEINTLPPWIKVPALHLLPGVNLLTPDLPGALHLAPLIYSVLLPVIFACVRTSSSLPAAINSSTVLIPALLRQRRAHG